MGSRKARRHCPQSSVCQPVRATATHREWRWFKPHRTRNARLSLPTSPRLAVLIDAENAYAAQVTHVMQLAATYGRPTVRRAYGDWTTPQLAPWKKLLTHLSIRPCQQFRYASGKNGSDCAMIMDAMDLLHSGSAEGFCIVSSDSDYTGLAARIREAGLLVYGFGQRHTVHAFAAACDSFTFLDTGDATLADDAEPAASKTRSAASAPQ